jgi:hypothetical protein
VPAVPAAGPGACPRCRGFVELRNDPFDGWEFSCANCGWVRPPATVLPIPTTDGYRTRRRVPLHRGKKL